MSWIVVEGKLWSLAAVYHHCAPLASIQTSGWMRIPNKPAMAVFVMPKLKIIDCCEGRCFAEKPVYLGLYTGLDKGISRLLDI